MSHDGLGPRNTQHITKTNRSYQRLLALSLGLAVLTGCSADYNGERLFWKAERLAVPLLKNPTSSTPAQFAKTLSAFNEVIRRAPGTGWAAKAQLSTGSLYAMQKEYAKARDAYALVLQNYHRYPELCLNARYLTAKTYEIEKHWDEAIKIYKDIVEYHPWTKIGLEAPLYIAKTYEQQKKPDETITAYERAAHTYTKLIVEAPTPDLAGRAKGYLAVAYERLGKWNDAADILETLLSSATGGVNRPVALLTLAAIYQSKLDKPKKAADVYRKLIQEFPDHQLSQVAKAQLAHLTHPEATGTPSVTLPQPDANVSLTPVTKPTPNTTTPSGSR